MTTHALHITFEAKEGAMMRIIGLIQRRGFETTGIDMPPDVEDGCREATVTVEARAPNFQIETLRRQIERLIEVREAHLAGESRHDVSRRSSNIFSFLRRVGGG